MKDITSLLSCILGYRMPRFHAAMNQIFRPYLRRFVIVFFDDFLVYSWSFEEHIHHLNEVLQCLLNHCLWKAANAIFFLSTIEHLGHFVSREGVQADPSKIKAMRSWPTPTNLNLLRGFLGLTCYYRRFVTGYALIAAPLTELLKTFKWEKKATLAFEQLKNIMMYTAVLCLPDFTKTFVVETDTSNVGVGGATPFF